MALYGKTDAPISIPKYINRGQITKVNVTAGGTGYGAPPTVTIAAPASGTQATATATLTGGVVTGITITNPGSGYTAADAAGVTFGSGAATATVVKAPIITPASNVVFVSVEEAQLETNKAKGITGAGWYLLNEKTDSAGQIRYNAEQLVAISVANATSGDAADDAKVADIEFAFTTQPVAATVTAPAAASFSVVVSVPSGATYVWQQKTGAAAYATVSNGGVYSTATTATLNISDSTGLNGVTYRCVVTSSGSTATITSKGARLTVA